MITRRQAFTMALAVVTPSVAPLTVNRLQAEERPVYDPLPALWEKFSTPMNEYVGRLNHGQYPADQLRGALRAWRHMEREMGWDKIR